MLLHRSRVGRRLQGGPGRLPGPVQECNGALARVVSPLGKGRGGVWRLEPQPGERATCPGPSHRRLRCADGVHLPGAWGVLGHAQREGLPRHGRHRHRPMGMRTERSTTGCATPSQQDRWSSRVGVMHLPGNGALPTCPSQCHVVVFAASTVHDNAAHRRRRGPRCQRMSAGPALVTANVEDVRHLGNLIKMVQSQHPRR